MEKEGYTNLYQAKSAAEAFKIILTEIFELPLLNIILPDIDGLEARKHICQELHLAELSIIMVTGNTCDEALKKI